MSWREVLEGLNPPPCARSKHNAQKPPPGGGSAYSANCAYREGGTIPPAPGLLAHIRRMAAFYEYTPEELAYAIEQARRDPEAWRAIVKASMEKRGWTLEGNERNNFSY